MGFVPSKLNWGFDRWFCALYFGFVLAGFWEGGGGGWGGGGGGGGGAGFFFFFGGGGGGGVGMSGMSG